MKITPATPIEMIIYYADLRDEYENASGKEKDKIYELAKKRFKKIDKNDLDESGAFKEGVNYNWDEMGLSF